MEFLQRLTQQPEYLHVLLNPLPVYGVVIGVLALIAALLARSRGARIVSLAIIFCCALSAWPVRELGEKAYDRVLTLSDDDGRHRLGEHEDLADKFMIYFFALALLSAGAIAAPFRWPKTALPLACAVVLLGIAVIAMGAAIAKAGGQIRHREFRTEPASM